MALRRRAAAALAGAAGVAALAAGLSVAYSGAASAATGAPQAPAGCAAAPSSCGYPDATNTGITPGTTLKTVPGQVSSGPGWHFDPRGWVQADGAGAVLSGLSLPYNINVTAPGEMIKNGQVTTSMTSNLVAGGGSPIYGGQNPGTPAPTGIRVTGNRVATIYSPKGGACGPAAAYSSTGTGNTWTANTWDTTGLAIPAP